MSMVQPLLEVYTMFSVAWIWHDCCQLVISADCRASVIHIVTAYSPKKRWFSSCSSYAHFPFMDTVHLIKAHAHVIQLCCFCPSLVRQPLFPHCTIAEKFFPQRNGLRTRLAHSLFVHWLVKMYVAHSLHHAAPSECSVQEVEAAASATYAYMPVAVAYLHIRTCTLTLKYAISSFTASCSTWHIIACLPVEVVLSVTCTEWGSCTCCVRLPINYKCACWPSGTYVTVLCMGIWCLNIYIQCKLQNTRVLKP